MMKKSIRKITCLVLAICMLCSTTLFVFAEQQTPVLSFLAMSDLHLDDLLFQTKSTNLKQYQQVLTAAGKLGLDAFIAGGDYSSYGNSTYWYKARTMAEQAGFKKNIFALGNHEYGTTGLRSLTWTKYLAFSGEKNLYYTKEINGITFIVLGAEIGIPNTFGYLSAVQKNWFAKALKSAAAKADGKPIFVVSHFDLDTGTMRKDLSAEMSKYENVFFLWGHQHGKEYETKTLKDFFFAESGFTAAKMGSVHYYNSENADGLVVRVYGDRVELEMMRVSGRTLSPDTQTVYLK